MHLPRILAAALACAATAAAQSFTLEQIMSAPFPTAPVVSRSGGKIAWVFNARGVRNVWVAEPPTYRGHSVTAYTADDGQEISELQWSSDGRAIVYVRGEGANGSGEYPNPTNDPKGAEQQVWVVAVAAGAQTAPHLIGEGNDPVISPRGGFIAFVRKGQVWSAPLDAADDGKSKAEQLIHARGQNGGLQWSPDGARLAFVSTRASHSFVGIYDVAAKTVHYLDASVDHDDAPVWAPDSRHVAFLRIPTIDEHKYFAAIRSGPPWSIRVADVDASEGHPGKEVWRAAEGDGSVFRQLGSERQLYWAGDRLVFPWERDGWTHLYSVPATGGDAAPLTPGNFEVEHAAMTPDGHEMVYSSNQDDVDRRHIWRVAAAGGTPVEVAGGTGLEWSPSVASDGALVFLHSDTARQARPAIRLASGEVRDLAPDAIPADFPSDALVAPQQVIFSAADGLTLHGQLFLPKSGAGQRHPAIVFFHGGSQRQMLLGWHYMYYYNNAYAMNQYLASRGYVVLSVNYRSGIGYGMKFREALSYGAGGGSEFNDVLGAGLYLKTHPSVDPARIGLWGGSYGGYLTALGLARASDLFAAGVDLHGVHDWTEELGIGRDDAEGRLAFNSSPMANVKDWRSPVLLIHGDDDRNVNFRQTVELVEALRGRVHVEQLIFPDEIHDFLMHAHWMQAYRVASKFFDTQLKYSAGPIGSH